jgi:5-methylcytosine-specific restriction protein B
MWENMKLSINNSYRAILAAARQGRFISYGEVAAASDVDWKKARRPMPPHLDRLLQICHERGWPLITSIVVSKGNLESGKLDGESLSGFVAGVKKLGVSIDNPQAFLEEQQQAVFAWAQGAPNELPFETETESVKSVVGPRFVRYFGPVLEALRASGGFASPETVFEWIKKNVAVDDVEINGVTKAGQSKYENKIGWARFYLAKAGLIDGSQRGVWKLTAEGRSTTLSSDESVALFRDIRSQFKASDDDEEPPPKW